MSEVPTLYDVNISQTRPVTQADFDSYLEWGRAHGNFLDGFKKAFDTFQATVAELHENLRQAAIGGGESAKGK